MTEKPKNSSQSQSSRVILWSVVLIGGAAVWTWGLHAEGNLDLSWLGMEEQAAVEKPEKKKTKSEKIVQNSKVEQPANKIEQERTPSAVSPESEEPVAVNENQEPPEIQEADSSTTTESSSAEESNLTASTPVVLEESTPNAGSPQAEDLESSPKIITEDSVSAIPPLGPSSENKEEPSTTQPIDLQIAEPSPLETLTNKSPGNNGPQTGTIKRTNDAPVPAKIIRYATNILEKHDIDRSTKLEPSEYTRLSNSAALTLADTDGDKIVTLDELSQYLANYGHNRKIRLLTPYELEQEEKATVPNETPKKSVVRPKNSADVTAKTPEQLELERRNGLKYSVKKTRVPSGTPSWFFTKDQDGDVQLSLSEYAPNASQKLVDEFRKFDLNRDGLVTPHEYLAARKATDK